MKVLLAEDSASDRLILARLVSRLGHTVIEAEDGTEAVELFRESQPDLVLLDVMMPGMDGPATLNALRNLDGGFDVPVVFMTARLQPAEIEEYRAQGAIGVIPKPFDPMTLAEEIRALVASRPEA